MVSISNSFFGSSGQRVTISSASGNSNTVTVTVQGNVINQSFINMVTGPGVSSRSTEVDEMRWLADFIACSTARVRKLDDVWHYISKLESDPDRHVYAADCACGPVVGPMHWWQRMRRIAVHRTFPKVEPPESLKYIQYHNIMKPVTCDDTD